MKIPASQTVTGAPIRIQDNPARRAAHPGTCAQLPPESGAVHVDASDAAAMVLAAVTAVLLIVFCNRISLSIGIEAVRFVVPVVTGGPRLLLSTSGIMKVLSLR